jgi:hypothetical protein
MAGMNELDHLSDDEIFKQAQALRARAMRGDVAARSAAERCVREARRRFSAATTLAASLESPPSKRPWWQLW